MRSPQPRRAPSRAAALLAAALLCLIAAPAAADLDSAKAAGQVGERIDGYVGLVDPGAPASVKALVDDVNGKRRQAYASIAEKNATSIEAVAARAGAKLVERAGTGEYVMYADGRWTKK